MLLLMSPRCNYVRSLKLPLVFFDIWAGCWPRNQPTGLCEETGFGLKTRNLWELRESRCFNYRHFRVVGGVRELISFLFGHACPALRSSSLQKAQQIWIAQASAQDSLVYDSLKLLLKTRTSEDPMIVIPSSHQPIQVRSCDRSSHERHSIPAPWTMHQVGEKEQTAMDKLVAWRCMDRQASKFRIQRVILSSISSASERERERQRQREG